MQPPESEPQPKLRPLIDVVFRRLFDEPELLIPLLNAILHPRPADRIVELTILSTQYKGPLADDKEVILDLRAKTRSGRQFHVEVQLRTHVAYAERMLFYWAGPYHGQLAKGKGYKDLRPVVSVHILGFCLLPQRERFRHFHHLFEVRERRTGYRLTDHLQLHTIELPKFRKQMPELATAEDRWVYYLENAAHMSTEQVHALGVPEIDRAEEKLRVISQDRELQMQYEQRMKAQRDAEVWKQDWIAEWLEQGEKKGEKKGQEKGHREATQQAILKILEARGLPISQPIRDRVLACQHLPTLERYLVKAAVAFSADEAIAE